MYLLLIKASEMLPAASRLGLKAAVVMTLLLETGLQKRFINQLKLQ